MLQRLVGCRREIGRESPQEEQGACDRISRGQDRPIRTQIHKRVTRCEREGTGEVSKQVTESKEYAQSGLVGQDWLSSVVL